MFIKEKNKLTSTDKIAILFLFVSTMVILLLCFSNGISGNDFWWHIKVGEYIQENKTIPTNDIFSWLGMEKNISWTAHEWLSDVIFYYIHNIFGEIGVFCFSVVVAMTLFSLLFFESIKHTKRNFVIGGLFFILFAIVLSLFVYGRPHVFSYFFLFFELKILFKFIENKNIRKLFWLPFIAVLWSNFHGGSAALSYILPLIFLIIGTMHFKCGRIYAERFSKKEILGLTFATLGSAIGILINPVGLKVLLYPYTSFSDTLMMNIISEWQAPDAKVFGNLILYFIPIAIMVIGMFSTEKEIRAIDIVIMGVFLLLFFRSARFIVLWYIASVFFAFRYIPVCKLKEIKRKRDKVIISFVMLLFIIPCTSFGVDIVNTYKNGQLISSVMSKEAIQFVKDDSPKRVFNDYNVGETLIYNDLPVFFDARADLYAQEHIMEDGISLMFLEQNNATEKGVLNIDNLIIEYKFDAILILKNRPLYTYLINNPDKYICKFEDETVGYFKPITK